jgi:hypothetical protein
MRKTRLFALIVLAALVVPAVALAQGNAYDLTAKVGAGGSKAKPKAEGFSFNFSISDPAGNVPTVIKTYKFNIGGARVNTGAVKTTCTTAKINAAGDDKACSSKAIVGTGSIRAQIGSSGTPWDGTTKCDLKLTAYAGGPNKVALYLDGSDTTKCVAPISRALDATWTNGPSGAALSFSVPDDLRHQLGLDVAVTEVHSTWKKLVGRKGARRVGYFESTGCKGKRSASVTFIDEAGTQTPVTKPIGSC